MKRASAAQVIAKNWTEAERFNPKSAYATLPSPIPSKATARISAKENVDPPRSGPSIRYQTSSIKKNTKPTTAAATNTNLGSKVGRTFLGSDLEDALDVGAKAAALLERRNATEAIRTLTKAAS